MLFLLLILNVVDVVFDGAAVLKLVMLFFKLVVLFLVMGLLFLMSGAAVFYVGGC